MGITDHGAMYGVIPFYREAVQKGLKPLVGCEIYLAPRRLNDRDPQRDDEPYHLTILARNEAGYRNLIHLVTAAWMEGFYRKPRVDYELLAEHSRGLIGLSGCLCGEIPRLLASDRDAEARRRAAYLRDLFGKEFFFLELMDHHLPEQPKVNRGLLEIAQREGIPLVASNDVHYLSEEDAAVQDILLCIQTKRTLHDAGRMRFGSNQFFLKTGKQMAAIFADVPQAISNTARVAEMCELTIEKTEKVKLPGFAVPEGFTQAAYLRHVCRDRLKQRLPNADQATWQRLEYELDVIEDKGFQEYFLIVEDLITYARSQGILVGPGRGSAVGSLVAYALGISDLNPLEHGLLFERFLNPEREKPPDIDMDFPDDRREDMIAYAKSKYGQANVAQIITFGTLAARAAIKDVGRVLGLGYEQVNRVAQMVPPLVSIEQALAEVVQFRELYDSDPAVRDLVDTSKRLEGLVRHASTHAAGIVITREPLSQYCPLQKTGEEGTATSQYDMDSLDSLGLMKMDFLAISTLTVVQRALEEVKRRRGTALTLSDIPRDDPATFELLCEADTAGVFQLESQGMRELLKKVAPERFEDIVPLVALYRPGPMGRLDQFVHRRQGRERVEYLHPALEPILTETYGVVLYQEQVMRIANDVGGFSMGQAEILMSAISKKRHSVMEEMRAPFIAGALKRGLSEAVAQQLYDLMAHFGSYGFNKSHSAAYGLVAYYTAYLKANFRPEYMAALISIEQDREKQAAYVDECRRRGIKILPPDVNQSGHAFTVVEDNVIRFGLDAVKGIGPAVVDEILATRQERPFSSIFDFCERVDPNVVTKAAVEILARCGAFDSLGKRAAHLEVCERAAEGGARSRRERMSGQISLFATTPSQTAEPELPEVEELTEDALLAMERELLGLPLSSHPLGRYEEAIAQVATATSADIPRLEPHTECVVAGIVTEVRSHTTRRGEPMLFFTLQDLHGFIEITMFTDVFRRCSTHVRRDHMVVVRGTAEPGDELTPRGAGRSGAAAKLICQEVAPLALERPDASLAAQVGATSRDGKALCITIARGSLTEQNLKRLQALLGAYPGSQGVFLRLLADAGREELLDLGEGCDASEQELIVEEIGDIFGRSAVQFVPLSECQAKESDR